MPQGPPFGPLLFLIYIFLNRSFIFRCFSKLVFQTFFKNHGHKIDNCSQPSDHSFIKLIFGGVKKDSIIHICYVFIKISPLNREHSSIFLLSKYQIQFWFLKFDSWNIHNLFSFLKMLVYLKVLFLKLPLFLRYQDAYRGNLCCLK